MTYRPWRPEKGPGGVGVAEASDRPSLRGAEDAREEAARSPVQPFRMSRRLRTFFEVLRPWVIEFRQHAPIS